MSVIFRKKMEAGSGEEERGGLRGVEGGETVVCNENKAKGNKYYHTGKGEVSTFKSVNFYPFLT